MTYRCQIQISDFLFSNVNTLMLSNILSSINKIGNAEVGGRGEKPWKGQRKHKRGNESCYKTLWTLVLGGLELHRENQRSGERGICRKRKWSRVSMKELWKESKRKGEATTGSKAAPWPCTQPWNLHYSAPAEACLHLLGPNCPLTAIDPSAALRTGIVYAL